MNIAVIFGSHRLGGTNRNIETMLKTFSDRHVFRFFHMADCPVEGCTSCHQCGTTGHCVLPPSERDHFQEVFDAMATADAIFIITPVYAVIPSRLTALLERLTSVLYDTGRMNTDDNPLLNKKVAVFSYCSCKICDDRDLKLIFDKFVTKDYSFEHSTYPYLNSCENPNERYDGIAAYVKNVVAAL